VDSTVVFGHSISIFTLLSVFAIFAVFVAAEKSTTISRIAYLIPKNKKQTEKTSISRI